jgi:hypothetical protein
MMREVGIAGQGNRKLTEIYLGILRIGFQNIGGFPINKGKYKEGVIRRGITKWKFDIFGCAETNIGRRLVPEEDKRYFRTKEWWETLHLSWTHNTAMAPVTACQYGGTALLSTGPAAHRAVEKGGDPSNLGRWTWTRYRGKDNQTRRNITAYRPNFPNGPFTVYAQHNAYFHAKNKPRCPRKAFLQDLCEDIRNFLEAGDNLILMIDGNTNMRKGDLKEALELCTLMEIILDKHGMKGPETFRRNNTKTPIDEIWASPNIAVKICGYFAYDDAFINTDHRCIWADISYINEFEHNKPLMMRPSSWRLHCKDPRIVTNYIRRYKEYILKHNLLSKLSKLQDCSRYPMSMEGKELYEELDSSRCKGDIEKDKLHTRLN